MNPNNPGVIVGPFFNLIAITLFFQPLVHALQPIHLGLGNQHVSAPFDEQYRHVNIGQLAYWVVTTSSDHPQNRSQEKECSWHQIWRNVIYRRKCVLENEALSCVLKLGVWKCMDAWGSAQTTPEYYQRNPISFWQFYPFAENSLRISHNLGLVRGLLAVTFWKSTVGDNEHVGIDFIQKVGNKLEPSSDV